MLQKKTDYHRANVWKFRFASLPLGLIDWVSLARLGRIFAHIFYTLQVNSLEHEIVYRKLEEHWKWKHEAQNLHKIIYELQLNTSTLCAS